ncbi:MAG: hypothetical protein JXL85_10160 [Bacilli bacterium]|nr:hypothetical protein [Bacilli bacterium]
MVGIKAYTVDAEEYERLTEMQSRYLELCRFLDVNNPGFVTVAAIGKVNGMSRQEVINKPWMMPNFGRVTDPKLFGKKRYWTYDEYLDWVIIPEDVRIKRYRQLDD